jgi:hypothetical protein
LKSVSLNELKKELGFLPQAKLLGLCVRLAKYKKENKELFTYLLFESVDEIKYIKKIKEEIDLQFTDINKTNVYYIKKSLRKILRFMNKYIKYSGLKETEAELRIYFCKKAKAAKIPFEKSTVLKNLYDLQLKKISLALKGLHEDLQYDYEKELEALT